MTLKEILIAGKLTVSEGGGGGGDVVKRTVLIDHSAGDVTFGDVLQAAEDIGYELSYPDCFLFFKAKGKNAYSSTVSETHNNFWVKVANWKFGNSSAYARNRYQSGSKSPDSFTTSDVRYQGWESNNPFSPNNMIDDNHKIVAGFTGSPIGGTGTTVTMYEIPMNWGDFYEG